jgi:thiamine phosphate synthase YjbQ (UPF0047 family)
MPSSTTARPSITQSIPTTFLLLAILFLAFFPNLFHYIWHTPLYLISPIFSPSPTTYIQSSPAPLTPPITSSMSWFQKTFTLPHSSRGSYLITDHVISQLPELSSYKVGLLNLFVQHTSCALSLNENWDEDVRADMSDALDRLAPEDRKGAGLYRHSAEGKDDMPVSGNILLIWVKSVSGGVGGVIT